MACVLTTGASAKDMQALRGPVRIVDGDTLKIAGKSVRIFGIDAPESDQYCGGDGAPNWKCGAWVTGEVRARYDGRTLRCVPLTLDKYKRVVARCFLGDTDIGQELVRGGLAFAYRTYSEAYVPDEIRAARRRAGLHATGVRSPSAFRAAQRRGYEVQRAAAAGGCQIKGNISRQGGEKIYHMPGQSWYGATQISPSRGERWFCSEADARAAGWRPARR